MMPEHPAPHRLAAAAAGAVLAAGLLSPAGAAAQEDTTRPEPPEAGARSMVLRPGAAADRAADGRALREIGLEEAVRLALLHHPELDRAEAELDGAEATRLGAWGGFLPSLDFGYGYSNSSTGRLDPTGQGITNTSWSAQLTASYDIFSGLRRVADLRGARRRVDAADARYEEQRYRTVLDVKTAFFQAVARRELAGVERRRVERQEAQLDSVRTQLDMGQVARTDVLRSEVALNNARLALVRAENAARTATYELARVVGSQEPLAPAAGPELAPEPIPYSRDELQAMAMRAGPSLASATAEAEAATAEIASAKATYLPDLTFAGGWAWQNVEFPPENRSWRIFLFGNYPLFNGLQRESRVDGARAEAEAARATRDAAALQLRSDVDSAYSSLEAALASIALAEKTVELAREELEMNRERFRLGRGTILELQEAQIALSQAEVDLVQARFDHQSALAQLEYLVGADLTPEPEGPEGDG